MKSRSTTMLCAGVAALCLFVAPIGASEPAIDLDENPALLAAVDKNPTEGHELLEEIDRLMQLPVSRNILKPPSGEQGQLLKENPALQEIYRRDPKATSKLLSTLLPLPN